MTQLAMVALLLSSIVAALGLRLGAGTGYGPGSYSSHSSHSHSSHSSSALHSASTEIYLSPMVEGMALSKTIEIHALTKELEAQGQEVLSLCVGEPDFQPPEEVVRAT
ncbi:hypothetical protein B484DRAFT_431503, partial [Ochromonadaceae sp. CCMP2298]